MGGKRKKEGRKREERGKKGKKGGKKGYAGCVWAHGCVKLWVGGRERKGERVRACVRVCLMFVSLVAILVIIQSYNPATTNYTRACI